MNFSKTYRLLLSVVLLCSFSIFASDSVLKISDINEAKISKDKAANTDESLNKKMEEKRLLAIEAAKLGVEDLNSNDTRNWKSQTIKQKRRRMQKQFH